MLLQYTANTKIFGLTYYLPYFANFNKNHREKALIIFISLWHLFNHSSTV